VLLTVDGILTGSLINLYTATRDPERRGRIRNAVLIMFVSISLLVLAIIAVGVAVTHDSETAADVGLWLVLSASAVMLAGLCIYATILFRAHPDFRSHDDQ